MNRSLFSRAKADFERVKQGGAEYAVVFRAGIPRACPRSVFWAWGGFARAPQFNERIQAGFRAVIALYGRRGASQYERNVSHGAAPSRDLRRVIARGKLALVALLMPSSTTMSPGFQTGRTRRCARPPRPAPAQAYAPPFVEALARRKAAVQHGHRSPKRARNRPIVCGVREISGTRTIACFPASMHRLMQRM
jgi:hypothetical protein